MTTNDRHHIMIALISVSGGWSNCLMHYYYYYIYILLTPFRVAPKRVVLGRQVAYQKSAQHEKVYHARIQVLNVIFNRKSKTNLYSSGFGFVCTILGLPKNANTSILLVLNTVPKFHMIRYQSSLYLQSQVFPTSPWLFWLSGEETSNVYVKSWRDFFEATAVALLLLAQNLKFEHNMQYSTTQTFISLIDKVTLQSQSKSSDSILHHIIIICHQT